ncbi:MAG: hypothetical protein M1828_007131 [Chrysothrix sp. TS-e1954]|nr:MAG: hypothetical protein M1828_007131 [Chrysothrix sp. TS-e1954]
MSVHIRPLLPTDIPEASTLAATAFLDGPLSAYLYPQRRERFDAYRSHFLEFFRLSLVVPAQLCFVAVHGLSADDSNARIVGCCIWKRFCPKGGPLSSTDQVWRRVNSGIGCTFERWLLRLEGRYHGMLNTEGADRARLREYYSQSRDWASTFSAHGLHSYWWLDFLCVSPEFQGTGAGGKLLDWGMQRAKDEGVPVGLVSSSIARKFYRGKGFKVVAWNIVEVKANLEGAKVDGKQLSLQEVGGAGTIWDPSEQYTMVVDDSSRAHGWTGDEDAWCLLKPECQKMGLEVVWKR